MERVLGKKQAIKNEEWLKAGKRIEELVPKDELAEKVRVTVEEIRERTAGKRAAYAWSAGKDSLVLGEICEKSEINDCMMAVCDLEYPAFQRWVDRTNRKGSRSSIQDRIWSGCLSIRICFSRKTVRQLRNGFR